MMKCVLDKDAILPVRAHATDAGYDLFSREDAIIYGGDCWTFDTGVHLVRMAEVTASRSFALSQSR